jgi:hypothetical protein
MKAIEINPAKPRRSKARFLAATVATTAALAGVAVPAALPATASAKPAICFFYADAFESAWSKQQWHAVNFWRRQLIAGNCVG